MHTVLIVEADDHALRARRDELLLDGYEVVVAQTERAARIKLADGAVDAVVLGELESPAGSLTLLRELRAGEIPQSDSRLPVVTIGTGSDHVAVRYYEAGADIVLPEGPSPLLIRGALAAVLSRTQGERRRVLRVGPLSVDCDARLATVHDRPLTLTRLEFDLLETLAQDPYRVHSRQLLAKTVWDTEFVSGRTIDSHAARLRSKLGAAGADQLLQTVRGVGYRLGR